MYLGIYIFCFPSYCQSVTLCIQYWFSCPIIYIVIRGGGEREEGWSQGRSLNKWYHHIIKCNIWYKFAVKSHCIFMKIKTLDCVDLICEKPKEESTRIDSTYLGLNTFKSIMNQVYSTRKHRKYQKYFKIVLIKCLFYWNRK